MAHSSIETATKRALIVTSGGGVLHLTPRDDGAGHPAEARMGKWRIAQRGRDEHWASRAHRELMASIRNLAPLMDRSHQHMIDEPPEESTKDVDRESPPQ
jgi:hypothetical protein